MLIDRSHKPWAAAAGAILAASLLIYIPAAMGSIPPTGGSRLGLAYGIAGFAAMVAVTLLSLRKKFPIWRIGRAQTWMRAHLWLGALTLPLVLLHGGLLFGHGLTAVLMGLFVIVYASGFFGAYLQHTMPRRLMREVPMETIYDQISHVRRQLLDEGDTVVADASGQLQFSVAAPASADAPAKAAANALASITRIGAEDTAPLREFHAREVRPFLEQPSRAHPLADAAVAAASFGRLRALVPAALDAAIADLESLCEEERQLLRQERMHRLLHGWLVVHVPLAFVLMTLAIVHIVMALRF